MTDRANGMWRGRGTRTVAAALALCLAAGAVSGCTPSALAGDDLEASQANVASTTEPLSKTAFLFDTIITLTAYCDQKLMDEALARCRYFEERFSRTREGSDVQRINEAQGEPVQVAPETADIIAQGIEFGRQTEGLFDITIGAVSSLWDFKEGMRPTDAQIERALAHVDYRTVSVDGDTVQLADPEAMIDLGGIAKGYIADDLAALFAEGGCESAIVNLGGNVLVVGSKPDGDPWNVGVQDPNAPTDAAVIAVRQCTDSSVVTSGLYERCFELDGTRYHHILDPRTGYPVDTDLLSVSVASTSSLMCDVYATWMLLLGHDAALAFLSSQDGLEGLVMDLDGTVSTTPDSAFALR